MKYSNWNKKKGITGNHFKLFELIEDLDDVSGIEFDREWHLEAFEKRNFINIEEAA